MKQKPSDLGRARGEIQFKESVAKAMTKVDGVPKATSRFHVGKIGTQLYGRSHIGKDSQELVCHLSRHTECHKGTWFQNSRGSQEEQSDQGPFFNGPVSCQ